ncbi:hypothetical protein M2650_16110 [Luteimonas sp. SX5]|uniref:Uncharacterized protein n=1 Tax=Luteimonas galliterrae TaxID=2940486 RepID=A0ABT0MMN1_9GAMM|nr:hypothetical protein [Luteimonas galliterrae]MCL1636147.1 hypothetical protein [Luteimonas galliterrae]
MIISFEGPVFFTSADEDQFFRWLGSLPEYQAIRGTGTTLELTLSTPVQPETVRQLLVIFRRWHLDVAPLLTLRSPETNAFVLWDTALAEASATGA